MGVIAAAIVPQFSVAQEGGTAGSTYEIPAMALKDALVALVEQTGLSISYNGAQLEQYRSGYVIGAGLPTDALRQVLERSPFTFEVTGEHTVQLIERPVVQPDPSNDLPTSSSGKRPDLIYVTATKRQAYAQKLPVSISAVDQNTLERWGVRDFNSLAPRLAGVSFTNLGPSRNKIFLRGVSDGSFADRTQSTVGVYLDETRVILNDTNPDIRLVDLERVEIVRGPQGSLYGGGSVGGLFRIITAKPDLNEYSARFYASGSATKHGGGNTKIDGAINLPVANDKFGIRLAGYFEHASGYIDDSGIGEEDVNSSDIFGARVNGRFLLSDRWTLDSTALFQVVDLDNTQYVFPNLDELRRSTNRQEPHRDEFELYSMTLRGDLAGARVTSSTAFVRRHTDNVFDATSALPEILAQPGTEGVFVANNKIDTLTHESRIVSDNGGKFDWLAGGFVAMRAEDLDTSLLLDAQSPVSIPFFSDRTDDLTEAAIFGEITYQLANRFSLTTGVRLSHAEFEVNVVSGGPANPGAVAFNEKRTRNSLAPKAAISYQYSDDVLIYAQAAQGSRIGGFNLTTPLVAITLLNPEDDVTSFESDTLWNTEIGIKSSWLDGDLIFNAAGFYIFWKEIQTDQILPNGFSFITNAGNARNYGFEVELTARPARQLELTGAVFWNDPQLTEANPFLGAEAGDPLPNIAEMSASAGFVYEFPLRGPWFAHLAADYSYVGESFLTFAEETAPNMGNYHLGNIRLTAQKENLRLGIFADNIGNTRSNSFAFGNAFSLANQQQATPLRPRTVGVFVEAAF